MKENKLEELALELFIRTGFRAVTMDRIAEEARVSKKTLYEIFGNKSTLVKRCTLRHLSEINEMLHNFVDNSDNAVEEVMCMMNFMSTARHFENNNILDLKSHYYEAYESFVEFQNEVVKNTIRDNIIRGQEEGYYRKDINIEVLVDFRIASINYIIEELKPQLPLNEFYVAVREIFNNFLRGLMTINGQKLYEKLLKKEI